MRTGIFESKLGDKDKERKHEMSEYKKKPIWLQKTKWGMLIAVIAVVLSFFGINSEWLHELAAAIGIEEYALGAATIAVINIILGMIAKWFFKKK